MNLKPLIIDFEFLAELSLSFNDLFLFYNVYYGTIILQEIRTENRLKELQEAKFIKYYYKEEKCIIELRGKALEILDLLTTEVVNVVSNKKVLKKSDRVIKDEIDKYIVEYRNKWRGLKSGSMGSLKSCKDKMFRWMKENPEYTMQDVLKAADIYLNGLNNYTYLQRADYFIFKQENNREESSRLSAFIDEQEVEKEDWTSNIN